MLLKMTWMNHGKLIGNMLLIMTVPWYPLGNLLEKSPIPSHSRSHSPLVSHSHGLRQPVPLECWNALDMQSIPAIYDIYNNYKIKHDKHHNHNVIKKQ